MGNFRQIAIIIDDFGYYTTQNPYYSTNIEVYDYVDHKFTVYEDTYVVDHLNQDTIYNREILIVKIICSIKLLHKYFNFVQKLH